MRNTDANSSRRRKEAVVVVEQESGVRRGREHGRAVPGMARVAAEHLEPELQGRVTRVAVLFDLSSLLGSRSRGA